jgi:RNA polymerase sigma-70 factor (ECF subfamily)
VYQTLEEPRAWTGVLKPTEMPDAHLVRMAQRDPAASVHIYDRYVDAIYRYCARRLHPAAAEDATSITFLNALKAIDRFDESRNNLRAWLFAIAHNAVMDQHRARRHDQIDGIDLIDSAASLDDHVVALDRRAEIDRAVATLPPDQQQVIHLRLASLTGPEIAQAMGKSHAAVRALQHRAISTIRSLLQPTTRDMRNHE